jgi:hypothetical protein
MTMEASNVRAVVDERLTEIMLSIAGESGRLDNRTLANVADAMNLVLNPPQRPPTPAPPAPPAGGDATEAFTAFLRTVASANCLPVCDQAADQIDRLTTALAAERAEVERLREVASVKSNVGERLHQLAVERDEARAAYERVVRERDEALAQTLWPFPIRDAALREAIAIVAKQTSIYDCITELEKMRTTPAPASDGMRQGGEAVQVEALTAALREIDRIATQHLPRGIGRAQEVARAALAATPPSAPPQEDR